MMRLKKWVRMLTLDRSLIPFSKVLVGIWANLNTLKTKTSSKAVPKEKTVPDSQK
jgi:hypothetical protein